MDTTKTTIDTYNKSADAFENKFMDYAPYKARVLSFCEWIPKNSCVLDIGCGPGNVAKLLIESDKNLDVVGVDLSPEMIMRAKMNVKSDRAKFMVVDIKSLVINAGEYDVVIASFCLPHLTDSEAIKLLNDIGTILRENGLLYLSCMGGRTAGFEKTSFSDGDYIYFNYYSEHFLRQHLAENGLEIFKFHKQDYPEADGSITTDQFILARKV